MIFVFVFVCACGRGGERRGGQIRLIATRCCAGERKREREGERETGRGQIRLVSIMGWLQSVGSIKL